MPKPAQDRMQRGPLAALLILFGLFLGSGTANATLAGIAAPAARAAPGRQGSAPDLVPSAARAATGKAMASGAGGPPLPAAGPEVVTQALWTGQRAAPTSALPVPRPQPGARFYRARAPPAA